MNPQIDLNLLRVFEKLYEERSVTRASRKLALTQSAVSGALARLRKFMGDPLFVQSADGMVPTARAEALAGPFARALVEVDAAIKSSREIDLATLRHTFSIKTSDHWVPFIARSFLPALRREAPAIKVEIIPLSSEGFEELRLGELDLLFSYVGGRPPPSLRVRHMFSEAAGLIIRRGHPREKTGIGIEEYRECEHVVLRPRRAWGSSPVDLAMQKYNIVRSERVIVSSFLAMPAIVENTDLVGSLPEALGKRFAKEYKVRYFPLPFPAPRVDVIMAWNERAHSDGAHQWLRDKFNKFVSRRRKVGGPNAVYI